MITNRVCRNTAARVIKRAFSTAQSSEAAETNEELRVKIDPLRN